MLKVVIFDFDGVIAESVDVKTQAFRKLFEGYPQYLEAITQFHITNGGMSRYDKFRYIYKNILKEHLSEERFKELCRDFSNLVVEEVILVPFAEGVRELLDKCLGRYKMFIISGTPDKEINKIVRHRGLEKYFEDVFGSPNTKTNLIKKVLKNTAYNPKEVIFIGDSVNDLQAARNTDVRFIARINEDNSDWAKVQEVEKRFKSMKGVFEYFEKIS